MPSLGIDVGSSAVKATLLDDGLAVLATAVSPTDGQLEIRSDHPGWAEQHPDTWWNHLVLACREMASRAQEAYKQVACLGLSYQEHGLVLLDAGGSVLRPAIIWCDSRTRETGRLLEVAVGAGRWLNEVKNLPGNFTVSKLAWVRDNEPSVYRNAVTAFLPGDYIAFRLTGVRTTTREGLSEGMFYSFASKQVASDLILDTGLDPAKIPPAVDNIGDQGNLCHSAAQELGLSTSTRVTFRAGDQHAYAVGLGVSRPGMATMGAGTSGVLFAVTDKPIVDRAMRINSFLHVTESATPDRFVTVLCINAVGIAWRWLRGLFSAGDLSRVSYDTLSRMAEEARPQAEEITVLPFGNGSERLLGNRVPGFSVSGVDLSRHGPDEVARATLDGLVFAYRAGMDVLATHTKIAVLRCGEAGLLRSRFFRKLAASVLGCPIEVYPIDPAFGAAFGAACGIGRERFDASPTHTGNRIIENPDPILADIMSARFERWSSHLARLITPKHPPTRRRHRTDPPVD